MIRPFHQQSDLQACLRIYREIGWIESAKHEKAAMAFFRASRGWVAELNGEAECMTIAQSGMVRADDVDLPLCIVGGVTTSRIARKQGLASTLTAKLLAEEAASGQAVALLGVFEQGYYNQFGFGNGSYDLVCTFDPSTLLVTETPRIPARLGEDDWQAMHEGRLKRYRRHGGCIGLSPASTQAEALWSDDGFGLGYIDDSGTLTHHFWGQAKGEHGPYRIHWMAYRTRDEFRELLALLKTLGDQVRSVRLVEPPGIQLQDFIQHPFRLRQLTQKSPHENSIRAGAYWQVRILDLDPCIASLRWTGGPLRFHLALSDPIDRFIPADCTWRGLSGDYVVELGDESTIKAGAGRALPTLTCSVNAFSRLWFGVRSASSLSWSDELSAPESLLRQLDQGLQLPSPCPDWEF